MQRMPTQFAIVAVKALKLPADARVVCYYRADKYDYDRDPYFYTAPNWRYSRGGKRYETNYYGADVLR